MGRFDADILLDNNYDVWWGKLSTIKSKMAKIGQYW